MRGMALRIIDLLTAEPGLNSKQITEKLQAKPPSVKVTLCKLMKSDRVTREKQEAAEKVVAGPKNLYVYKVKQ